MRRCKRQAGHFYLRPADVDRADQRRRDSYGLTAHSVLMADHWRYDPSRPVSDCQRSDARTPPMAGRGSDRDRRSACADVRVGQQDQILPGACYRAVGDAIFRWPGQAPNLVCASSMHAHRVRRAGADASFPCTKVNMRGAATAGGEWTDRAALSAAWKSSATW